MKKVLKAALRNDLAGVGFTLLLLVVILCVFTEGFVSAYNIDSILKDIAVFTIVGMAQMCTLSVGQFNLAIGAIGGCVAMVFGALVELVGIPFPIAIIVGVIVGLLLGYVQGFLIVKTKINPFIITLALINVFHGINMTATENMFFRQIPEGFKAIGKANVFGFLPVLLLVVFVFMLVFYILYMKTIVGRRILATGVSKRAADFAGINADRNVLLAHILSGLLAACAGLLTVSKLGAAQTSIGDTWMLYSFASPILGGTLLNGGKVNVVGCLLGAGLMVIITNALVLFGVNAYWFQCFTGSVLLLAFAINKMRSTMSIQSEKEVEKVEEVGVENEN